MLSREQKIFGQSFMMINHGQYNTSGVLKTVLGFLELETGGFINEELVANVNRTSVNTWLDEHYDYIRKLLAEDIK